MGKDYTAHRATLIQKLIDNHPVYRPDSGFTERVQKTLDKLPLDVLQWLGLFVSNKSEPAWMQAARSEISESLQPDPQSKEFQEGLLEHYIGLKDRPDHGFIFKGYIISVDVQVGYTIFLMMNADGQGRGFFIVRGIGADNDPWFGVFRRTHETEKKTPSNCKFWTCDRNQMAPGENNQECIGCSGNINQNWKPGEK